jgi:5-methylcytosine-specific restriction endonuclease McrA
MNQREPDHSIFSDLAKQRIKDNQCAACGKPRAEWDKPRFFCRCCCKDCTTKFWKEQVSYNTWSLQREKCFNRDGWRCVKCGLQPTVRVRNGYQSIWTKVLNKEYDEAFKDEVLTVVGTLICDHILAIALGGSQWDIDNLQTLCINCNKIKTAEDAGKIAKLRNIEKKQSNGQKLLVMI